MMQSGLDNIWVEMNDIDDNDSITLLELARFPKRTEDELHYFEDHYDRHKTYHLGGKEYTMTKEEYDDNADSLSSFPGVPIGSGTTGVACLHTDRNFIGIEKEQKYFETAQKRIKEASSLIIEKIMKKASTNSNTFI